MNGAESIRCHACGSAAVQLWGPSPPFPEANLQILSPGIDPESVRGQIYRCSDCGLGFREPALTEPQLHEIYSTLPSGEMVYPFETNGAWVKARQYLTRRWLTDEPPKVLDVGCYEGLFLDGLPARWRKFGLESSGAASDAARKRGVEVIGGFLGDAADEYQGFFDMVCMFDVFEHLLRPADGLKAALRYVKPGGVLLVSTADMDAWNWRWLGPANWYLEIPIHVSIASRRFFSWFSRAHGVGLLSTFGVRHRTLGLRSTIDDAVAVVYMGCRSRGGLFRIPQRLIQLCAPWRNLMHRTSEAFTPNLKDHLVVCMTRGLDPIA